jgi:hypothetical protein
MFHNPSFASSCHAFHHIGTLAKLLLVVVWLCVGWKGLTGSLLRRAPSPVGVGSIPGAGPRRFNRADKTSTGWSRGPRIS